MRRDEPTIGILMAMSSCYPSVPKEFVAARIQEAVMRRYAPQILQAAQAKVPLTWDDESPALRALFPDLHRNEVRRISDIMHVMRAGPPDQRVG